jgi:hypothetical protein
MSAEPVRGALPRQARSAPRGAEPDETAAVDVVFSPAEPILNPGAARAVLDLLLRAYDAAHAPARPKG